MARNTKPIDDDPREAQLSDADRVNYGVSSIALSREVLAGATGVNTAGAEAGARSMDSAAAVPSDADVMLRVQAGDDSAFNHLVAKFRRPMVSFMFRMARNQAVAEELAQEVFLRVYRSRSSYAAEAKFTTWLYRIATNLALNHLRDTRQERVEAAVSLDEPDPESGRLPDVADGGRTAEQEMLRSERARAIRRQVDELPDRQRLAVLMHKYQEMDYREIAKVLRLSESATKSLLFRAYETLREKLKGFV